MTNNNKYSICIINPTIDNFTLYILICLLRKCQPRFNFFSHYKLMFSSNVFWPDFSDCTFGTWMVRQKIQILSDCSSCVIKCCFSMDLNRKRRVSHVRTSEFSCFDVSNRVSLVANGKDETGNVNIIMFTWMNILNSYDQDHDDEPAIDWIGASIKVMQIVLTELH